MPEFFCTECADKSDEAESLCVGCLGIHICDVCGRKVDCQTEGYHVFREGAKERLKIKEESQANAQQAYVARGANDVLEPPPIVKVIWNEINRRQS